MTTPSECFKKRVKSNTCELFNAFIMGVIIFLPSIVFVVYCFTLPTVSIDIAISFSRMNFLLFWGFVSSLINAAYAWVFAFPFIKCYFGVDLK